ncbi:unnamed protein product [Mytilus coruscus]|uniref:Uncharacterized protein n=1 Tax=Mytilus coruscus TaxID=42192 RepID=A0A6J8DY90_MYTCO|nr:unnamed protein product [Mytilus coruscus]
MQCPTNSSHEQASAELIHTTISKTEIKTPSEEHETSLSICVKRKQNEESSDSDTDYSHSERLLKCDEVKTALGMDSIYNRVVEFLTICIDDPQLIIENGIKLFIGMDLPDDGIFSSLLEPSNSDSFTKDIIVKFCTELKLKCVHLFKDFMPSGKYYKEVLQTCQSCPSHNISVERLMAKLDNSLINPPTYNTNSMDSVIMYKKDGQNLDDIYEEYENQTGLHAAAISGSLIILHILVQAGASINVTDPGADPAILKRGVPNPG